MARLLIADDHDVVICGLRQVIRAQDRWEIVAEAGNERQALAGVMDLKPDVAVIAHSSRISASRVTRIIRANVPRTEVLVFAAHHSEPVMQECLSAQARGYLLKSDPNALIVTAIQTLLVHRPFISPQILAEMSATHAQESKRVTSQLTQRQRMIVRLIAEGHSNKAAAIALNISLKTVETHRAAVMQRLNLSSPAALVRYAVRNHIVDA
jgi:DNA-binding NarL/FixJ family response regulator